MGCQATVVLEDDLTFSICTHDPDTGESTDADAAPPYRVYEDEVGVAILNGNMAILDNGNTTGFYTEQIACTAVNGFEIGKSYTVYIEAVVGGDQGAICYGFTMVPDFVTIIGLLNNLSTAQVNAEMLDVLNVDVFAEPGQEAPPTPTSVINAIVYLYKFMRNKHEQTAAEHRIFNDAGAVVDHKATTSDVAGLFTRGEVGTGP